MAEWQPLEEAAGHVDLALEEMEVFCSESDERCAAGDLQGKGDDCDGEFHGVVACDSKNFRGEGFRVQARRLSRSRRKTKTTMTFYATRKERK